METKVKHSTKLVCGALLASVMGGTQVANADPTAIIVNTFATRPTNPSFSNFTGTHQFGGPPTILGGFYSQTVTSGLSQRPGWQYELNVDYANFGDSYFLGGGWSFVINLTIKDENTNNPINAVQIKDQFGNVYQGGTVTHTNGSIHVQLTAEQVIAGSDWVTIQWNQGVPAPGALALLGLAGAVGSRRRRA